MPSSVNIRTMQDSFEEMSTVEVMWEPSTLAFSADISIRTIFIGAGTGAPRYVLAGCHTCDRGAHVPVLEWDASPGGRSGRPAGPLGRRRIDGVQDGHV